MVRYFTQMMVGLEYLHSRSVVRTLHPRANVVDRDIKPANMLITADGVLKIADFGVADVLALLFLTIAIRRILWQANDHRDL